MLFLVYRILMILIIAIIINIMIAIVTVNVVITGIIIMKTCLFFIIAVFINVIINDVIVFGYIFFFKSISLSQSDSDISFFHVWKTCTLFFFVFCQSSSCRGGVIISLARQQINTNYLYKKAFHVGLP